MHTMCTCTANIVNRHKLGLIVVVTMYNVDVKVKVGFVFKYISYKNGIMHATLYNTQTL